MVSINKTLNFVVKQGEQLAKSHILNQPNITNFKGLKYVPQNLSNDVVQIGKKARVSIDIEKLQMLADKDLTLNEIATELDLPMSTVRFYMEKHNIITNNQKNFRIIKEYFSANTSDDKAKAYKKIDEYLKQLAKKNYEQAKGPTYEDCLQDARLKFFEILDKAQKKDISRPRSILKRIAESKPVIKNEIADPEILEKAKNSISSLDTSIDAFETADFKNHFLNYLHTRVSSKTAAIFDMLIKEGKTTNEISQILGLSTQRVQYIFEKELPNAKKLVKQMQSTECIHSYASQGHKTTEEIASKENVRNLYKLKGSNYYLK